MDEQPKKLKKIKSSLFARGFGLAKLTAKASAGLAGQQLKKWLASDEAAAEHWRRFLETQARHFKNELGEMKGSLMKAGQTLSVYGEHFLPPEANRLLKSLQFTSPPLEWPAIEQILRAELGAERLSELEIEKESVGSASLGQVHRARVKSSNEVLALKVQYAGVEKAIDSDLRALKAFLGFVKVLPKDFDLDPILAEVRAMLVQELDYETEAELTKRYGALVQGDARYVVPRVHSRYSTKKILATSFEDGVSPDAPEVLALPQERKNLLALNFVDLYFHELFDWGVMQTDPHLGNYKIRLSASGQDQLVLLDFGAVKVFDPDFLRTYRRMIFAALDSHREWLQEAAFTAKFIDPNDSQEAKALFEQFCLSVVEPFLLPHDPRLAPGAMKPDGRYDWKNSDLPQRLSRVVMQLLRSLPKNSPPREILFLDRKTGGVFIFCAVMGAQIVTRPLLLKHRPPNS